MQRTGGTMLSTGRGVTLVATMTMLDRYWITQSGQPRGRRRLLC
jgi:hypothetical protein